MKFENKWVEKWEKDRLYATPTLSQGDTKEYVLDMYPYPSGSGLHVGHVEGYTATDIYCRYMRMKGKKILHPIGFDSFGLPAENYAVKTGTHPKITTEEAIATFTGQMKALGLSYDWDLVLAAHRPDYYKWTQWLFLLLYKRGLAYRKKQAVNWCNGCQTVLANEQVVDGKCERCDTSVVQKDMEQWFLKITDYAERLLHDLDALDWPESTKAGQRNWIGKSEGAIIEFKVESSKFKVEVFSTAHDTIFGATFLVLAPEHPLVEHITTPEQQQFVTEYIQQSKIKTEIERSSIEKTKSGVFTGTYVINPVNQQKIPVWIADYVLMTYGSGAIMAVPGADERDHAFALTYDLPIIYVTAEQSFVSYTREIKSNSSGHILANSDKFSGMTYADARPQILKDLVAQGVAQTKTVYKLRDWLISRQRFWGAPIPMRKFQVPSPKSQDTNAKDQVETYTYEPVGESELPVVLPMDVEFKPTGKSPLTEHPDFKDREVDTMDTFVDSSWYFFRFAQLTSSELRTKVAGGDEPNPFEDQKLKEVLNAWCPVDLYVGGAEHTVLHLLYARFFTKVLYDAGYIAFQEPFLKLRHQGIILGPDHRKMSKRWGNVINPLDVIREYGADTLRMYEMFLGPLDQMKTWNVGAVAGIHRFLSRVWNMGQARIASSLRETNAVSDEAISRKDMLIALHKMIKKVTEDIPELKFNTAIAECMIFMNAWEKAGAEALSKKDLEKFLLILAPYAPYITEELWLLLGHSDSIHIAQWPEFDPSILVTDTVEIPVQVNGKVRGTVIVSQTNIGNKEIVRKIAEETASIAKHITGTIVKVIYVPGKILNIITRA